jgi:glycosyltransferase involved in cell wall biosynthesis
MARECVAIDTKIIVRECIELSSFIHSVPTRRKTLLPFIKLLYPLADKVVSVAHKVEEDLLSQVYIPSEKSTTIYNPVIDDDFQQKADAPVQLEWLNDNKHYVILGAGRLSKQKDFTTLISAFAHAKASNPSLKLIILGEGDERYPLQQQIEQLNITNDVLLHGFVNNPLSYMSKADVFVLPSLLEGAPNVLVEALACGCQVISTDSPGGSSELLHNGKFGALVAMKDTATLSKAILDIYSKKISFSGGEVFAKKLTSDRSLKKYIASCFPNKTKV